MSIIQQTFEIPGATEIRLEGWGDVHIELGEQETMTIETEADLLPKLKTTVREGRLELGYKNPLEHLFQFRHPPVRYTLVVRRLESVRILGSGTVTCPQAGGSDALRLGISGSGKMRFGELHAGQVEVSIPGSGEVQVERLTAGRLNLSIPGSGRFTAAGSVPHVEAGISGSGQVHGERLEIENAGVRISGSGRVDLTVSRELDVKISGSGQMNYRGAPAVHSHISGSGRVHSVAG